ncbi:hypothetical protein Goshw_013642 [Gossypium schwendimanii]|uniref:Aminotransferase-like plant mobile domain-containing protein n=1 Tax=Gossypium schwendimanii TaxID=34291 RepID=A0A7J9M3H3_GOSSC|nr:hypothetical protein [Gossypium schwendimanii]
MPDLSRNLVHLRWLLKLVDFRVAGELSWGSAVLATLYREMCGATRPSETRVDQLCDRGDAPEVFDDHHKIDLRLLHTD